jgi:AcrR family transcriptional regulator
MTRRAELVDETRLRITEAAVKLHTTVGPSHTSIAGIAEEAGVTRLTVYRHFADLDALFEACRAHWLAQGPPPDPRAWAAIPDLETRARHALGELYAWYGERGDDLLPINRDAVSLPSSTQEARALESRSLGEALIAGHVSDDASGHALRAVAGHLVDFWTWRSLVVLQGLEDRVAVDIAVRFLMSEARRA